MVHCWKTRHEVMGYADVGDALVALSVEDLDRLAAESGRSTEEDEWGYCWHRMDVLNDMCMEEEGHAGPCRFVPEDAITLTFRR